VVARTDRRREHQHTSSQDSSEVHPFPRSIATRNIPTIPAVQLQSLLCPNSVEQRHLHRLLGNTSQVSPEHFSLVSYDALFLKRQFIAKNNDYYRKVYVQAHSDVARLSHWDLDVRSILRFIISVGFQSIQWEQLDV
jgi:hypothetical protein